MVWKGVEDHSSPKDGELYFQPAKIPAELEEYLKGTATAIDTKRLTSEVPCTQLWQLTPSKYSGSLNCLGTPCSFSRWFSLVRIWAPWLAPRHGQDTYNPKETALLSAFLRSDGLHLVILPISGVDDALCVLRSDSKGNVIFHQKRDSNNFDEGQVLVAAGRTFEAALAAAVYRARRIVSHNRSMSDQETSEMKRLCMAIPEPEWMENWYDGLAYCTWNGLGPELNQQKIFHALDMLKASNIKITSLIIDDSWQSLNNAGESQFKRGCTDFEANKEGFPNGLGYTVTEIRDNHPNIEHVAVWHALFGNWGGISPTGNIAKEYKTKQVRIQPVELGVAERTMTIVDADDAARYFNDFYKFLLESRVDSVKTDAQFFLDLLQESEDRRRFTTTYQDAWTIASLRYFATKSISSMSQIPQIMFHTQLPTDKPRLVLRNSDDFFPDVPASHPWHIFTNAHNALFTSHLNVIPDWDMFQTRHPYASFHAAGRCISGGPITITDEPGKHDIDLINQITAETTQGKTVVLRPDVVGKSIGVYTAYEEERLLKVGTFVGGKGGISILGCFNVSQRPLYEFVHLSDFRGIEEDDEYTIYSYNTGTLSQPMTLEGRFPIVSLDLDRRGWEILTAYPLRSFTLRGSQGMKDQATRIAVLGLLGKMTGAAALLGSSTEIGETGRLKIKATLKALGVLGKQRLIPSVQRKLTSSGIYISTLQSFSIRDHFIILIYNRAIPIDTVSISKTSTSILEIDVQRAWNEMGLNRGWSNELSVDVFIK